LGVGLQEEFVISGHDNFVPVRHFAEPIIEVINCLHIFGKHGEIAGMNENVAGWNSTSR
jgi:hypothetical protein